MSPLPSTLRHLLAAALLPAFPAAAAPSAVNDSFTTPEDTPAGSAPATLLNATFDGGTGGIDFALPNAWETIDLKTTAAGGSNAFPQDALANSWKAAPFDSATSTIPGWRNNTLPAQGGGITNANFTNLPATFGGFISGGPNTVNTYLARNRFTLTETQAAHPSWNFTLLADDGCVIYLNGLEKARLNCPPALNPDDLNGGTSGDEINYTTLAVDLSGTLLPGPNVIAIELHQNSPSSSDAGLDFTMAPASLAPTAGFTALDDPFFATNNPNSSSQNHAPTGGFNATGTLRLQLGNVAFGASSQAVSGGWRKTFTLDKPATVSLSLRHRLLAGQDYDSAEYQEALCEVDGVLYGSTTSPSTHPSLALLLGNGNGGGSRDSGWQTSSFEIPLTAGEHTLTLGAYGSAGSAGLLGNAQESFEAFFDDVSLTAPSSLSLLANDTGGSPPVTAIKDSDPAHGTASVSPDGSFRYTPEPNWSGLDSFTYRASDPSGTSPPATVSIQVTPLNDLPIARSDGPYATSQETLFTVSAATGLLANDSDVESANLSAILNTPSPDGITQLQPDGSFTFAPTTGFSGTTSFTYLASDGTATSAPATVTIVVDDLPASPSATADAYTALRNATLTISATTPGLSTEELIPFKAPDWHYYDTLELASRNLGTTWRTDAYTESTDWKIGPAELGYGDGDEATLIADNPDPAFASSAADKFATAYFRRTVEVTDPFSISGVEISVLYDDACAFYLNDTPAGRTSNLPTLATLPELPWDYYPSGNVSDNSTQTFTLPANSLLGGRNLIAAEVHQNGATSSDLSFDLRLRITRTISAGLLANDSDPDVGQTATLSAQLISPPTHGLLSLNPNGTFTYTPDNNYTGPDSFTYLAKDSTNLTSNVATASITVISGPNAPPRALPDAFTAAEDTLLSVDAASGLLANDTDPEGDPFTAALISPPAHGALQLQSNGAFTYLPAPNFNGTDSFTYRASDAQPSAPATVTITVSPLNDLPRAAADAYAGDPGVPLLIPAAQGVLSNDSDPDADTALSAVLLSPPAAGSLELQPDGSFSFLAPSGGTFSFTYQAKDNIGLSAPATVTLSLNATPTCLADSYSLDEDAPLNPTAAQGVLANDADPEGQTLRALLATPPLHGTLNLNPDGSFRYTPTPDFHGPDQFSYRADDGTRQSAPIVVSLAIAPLNDAPVALADVYGVRLDSPLLINAANGVLRNDRDVDSDSLTAALLTPPATGTLQLNPDGSFSFSPELGFSGTASFTYRASDGSATSAATTVTLNVSADLNTLAITEIMYNPPGQAGALEEFIEVHNYGDAALDLTGWSFTKGVNYTFPVGLLLPSRAYLAIPANPAAFAAKYPAANATTSAWDTTSSLANGGETLRLTNAAGRTVAEVTYADEGDWAVRQIVPVWDSTNTPGATPPSLDTDPGLEWVSPADPNPEFNNPGGASLQLRNLALSHQSGQNWAPATPTPGAPNTAVAQENSAPLITDVSHSPAVPNRTQQVFVTARLHDEQNTGLNASLFYRTWLPSASSPATAFTEVPLADNGLRGDAAPNDGLFGAVIPAQSLDTVVEFYVRAADASNQTRTWPAPTLDLAGANPTQNANCLYQVNEEAWTDQRPLYQMIMTGADNASWNAGLANRTSNAAPNTTVIFRTGNQVDIRYQAAIRTRGNSSRNDTPLNLRLNLPKDHPWNGRSAFTLNYKYAYSQFLASRLFEAAGVPCEKANLVGGRLNGVNRLLDQNGNRTFGYYCDLVPRGADTIKEWFPGNDSGNGYGKIRGSVRWGLSSLPTLSAAGYAVGGYVNEGYTKQSNAAANDWSDLHAWLQSLNAGSIADFHTTIANTVDVDQWCRFLALSTIVNHAETNMANGDDDDYSIYFGTTDKLCRIIPHDFDTCFNLNAIGLGDEIAPPTLSIYQATEPNYPTDNATLPQMDKFYRNPVLGRKFKAALRHYLDTLFTKATFDATVDQLLDPQWIGTQFSPSGDTIRAHIKNFLDTRRATIETFLPTAFTATTSLPLQNGLPRTTSATDLGTLGGKLDPARTASVTVNGLLATTNPYGATAAADNSWTASSALTLQPGINQLLCEARDPSGLVFASQTLTIWFDAPGVTRSGSLAASEAWTPSAGPYNISSSLTVPSGVTLTIQPGTTVYLASGANLTVSSGGRLLAPGTAAANIQFTRLPSATTSWGGLIINGGSATLSYLTFANNASTALHSFNGAVLALDHLSFRNTAVPYLSLDASSFVVSDCVFPSSTASFEPVHGSSGIAPGGQAIIRRCWFGKTQGYSDSIDFTGGNRPGPILQILNCTFTGSDDDLLDLDSTDAWIEGNLFLHCHRNGASPDSSSAVSGGADNAAFSQVTVINNLFYDCDNAVTMKQGNNQPNGNSAVLLNNTIVRTTRVGGIDNGSGIVNFDDDNVSGEGKGMYLEGNIIWDTENLARNYNPALSQLTLRRNLLPSAPPAGSTASDNLVADPLLNLALIPSPSTATPEQVRAALQPQLGSPAIGAGPLGRTLGADLSRTGITLASPPASTWPATLTLDLGPAGSFTPTSQAAWTYGFTHYRYRLDSETPSAESPLSSPLTLANLSPGPHTLLVEGRNDAGAWQESPTALTFTVAPDAPTVVLSEILAASATSPDLIELHNWGPTDASLVGCRLSDDAANPAQFTFPANTPPIPAGGFLALTATQLGFSLDQGGETLLLTTPSGLSLDSLTFGPQIPDLSLARQGSLWRLATPSPGSPNPPTAALPLSSSSNLHINEWLGSNSIIVTGDFVELYNPDPRPLDLAGYRLSQDFLNQPDQNQFPPLSFIAGSGFLQLIADGNRSAGPDHLSFKVSRIRESLSLLDPAGAVLDTAIVLPGYPDVSQGRTPDGAATTTYLPLPTPGFSNGSDLSADTALMNGLRLTELMFDPPGLGAEFTEFKNISAAPLTLDGVNFGTGLTFAFPATTLAPGAYIVLTGNLPRFQSQYPGVPALAWSAGRLDNSGEPLRIQTAARSLGILDFRYDGNWYPQTRSGASLEIIDPTAPRLSWADPSSWQPSLASPGGPSAFGVLAPADLAITSPEPAILSALVSPGSYPANSIALAWSKVSGPGNVTFTAPANKITDAAFSLPGLYELRLSATPTDAPASTDSVAVTVRETYLSWSQRHLASFSAADQDPAADADRDGLSNLIEYALGSSPSAPSAPPELILSGGRLALRYQVSRFADPSLQIIPQVSADLHTWLEGGTYLNQFIAEQSDTSETHVAEALDAVGSTGQRFLRLKVVAP